MTDNIIRMKLAAYQMIVLYDLLDKAVSDELKAVLFDREMKATFKNKLSFFGINPKKVIRENIDREVIRRDYPIKDEEMLYEDLCQYVYEWYKYRSNVLPMITEYDIHREGWVK